ncbi:S-adenosyl-L-methionine-dependent methyltransferase [Geopyxis carbonaria]|nr:S-adenosyl-L-methionine-dependent methyltransferase [Geopyxis carbonaria]
MPRLPPHLLIRAHRLSPHLPPLLQLRRTLSEARSELRWLTAAFRDDPRALARAVRARARLHKPLQYILGTQPFGPLELRTRRGVLIPRWETEEWAAWLAGGLAGQRKGASGGGVTRVLDLCTGTGCVALLLAASLGSAVRVTGVDISPTAVALARRNAALHHIPETQAEFMHHDVFDPIPPQWKGGFGVLTANPPYIDAREWWGEVERSTRVWEPREALVAEQEGDRFYGRILEVAGEVGARVVVVEVGGWGQGGRVCEAWRAEGWSVGMWKDAAGRGRCVVAWKSGGEWVQRGPHDATEGGQRE